MPKVSIISIAKNEYEFKRLKEALERQTFKDFELVTSTKGSIPEAWNDALSRANGEIIVFIESDAFPLNERWLEEIVQNWRKGIVLKGLEINPTHLNLSNFVCDAEICKKVRFDENFKCVEDTEYFVRLKKMGVEVGFVNAFPVVHISSRTWRKTLSRSLRSGMYYIKLIFMYGQDAIDIMTAQNFENNYMHPVLNRLRIITENILVLFGLFIGTIYYLPIFLKRKLREREKSRRYHENQ